MALISAKTIITSLSLFHVMLGYFFLTNPGTLADQAIVYMFGEAMGMVRLTLSSLLLVPCRRAALVLCVYTDFGELT